MRIISKSDNPISAFEVYETVAKELSRIPKENQLNETQLRRKFCYLSVLEQVGRYSAVPSIDDLDLLPEERNALASYGLTASVVTSREKLDGLLGKLHG